MAVKISYILSFDAEESPAFSTDFLAKIDRIMSLIKKCDLMIAETLGYSLGFHSMLASMESQRFLFQVDMEIQPPLQLILGDRMSQDDLFSWFSQSHEQLVQFILQQNITASWSELNHRLAGDFHCYENLLYRPLDPSRLDSIRDELSEIQSAPDQALSISMKKVS